MFFVWSTALRIPYNDLLCGELLVSEHQTRRGHIPRVFVRLPSGRTVHATPHSAELSVRQPPPDMARFAAALISLLPLTNGEVVSWKSVCVQTPETTLAEDGRRHVAVDCSWKGDNAVRLTGVPDISNFALSKTVTLGIENHEIARIDDSM